MKLERIICVYSNDTDEFLYEISVNHLTLDDLKKIITPLPDDDFLYYVYPINLKESISLNKFIECDFDFIKNSYYLECVYDNA